MTAKPQNRFEAQIVLGNGYINVKSRKGGLDTPMDVISRLREFCDQFEEAAKKYSAPLAARPVEE